MTLGRFLTLTILATMIAGTLHLIAAVVFSKMAGVGMVGMLMQIATGIVRETGGDIRYALVGLFLHYAIIAAMAGAYMIGAAWLPLARSRPLTVGAGYGLLLWAVMHLVVLPLRWPGRPVIASPLGLFEQMFAHVVLVGMPIALLYAQFGRPAPAPAVKPRRAGATPARAPRR